MSERLVVWEQVVPSPNIEPSCLISHQTVHNGFIELGRQVVSPSLADV